MNVSDDIYIVAEVGSDKFGSWASNQLFKTEFEARDALSILQKFKKHEVGLELRKYQIKPNVQIPIRESIAGPLKENDGIWKSITYKGGATQFEFLIRISDIYEAKQFFKKIQIIKL